ncbi:MAG: hypothetical protein M1825_002507 [Sarcosagium campestre]|nr:MAG: hypothetical protein M1825_002507 [Sarcosagium campestre]
MVEKEAGGVERPFAAITQMGDKPYIVALIKGKGLGLIARIDIARGARILCEAPIIKMSHHPHNWHIWEKDCLSAWERLSTEQRAVFLSFRNSHVGHGPMIGTALTARIPIWGEVEESGVFLEASLINHSCSPNSLTTWNTNLQKMTLHAIRDISKGDEITISYLNHYAERAARQCRLWIWFHFECHCELCSLPEDQSQASDVRRAIIAGFTNMHDEGCGKMMLVDPLGSLRILHTLHLKLKEDRQVDASIARVYEAAFEVTVANGDQARAKVFAERAHAHRAIIEGSDSPQVINLAEFAQNPANHSLFGISTKWFQDVTDIPRVLPDKAFDCWLWKGDVMWPPHKWPPNL